MKRTISILLVILLAFGSSGIIAHALVNSGDEGDLSEDAGVIAEIPEERTFAYRGTNSDTDTPNPDDNPDPDNPDPDAPDPDDPDPEDPTDPENPENPENPEEPTKPAEPEKPTEPEEPAEPAKPDDPNRYAQVYLLSYWNGFSPHICIYVENLTEHDIKVGAYTCPKGQGVSVGSLGFSVADGDGAGVYYNIETWRFAHGGKKPLALTISRVATKAQLENLTKFILNNNTWEFFMLNCAWFAAMCWDRAGGSFILPYVMFPSLIRLQMLFHHPTSTPKTYEPTRDQVMRQVGKGKNATVRTVVDKSL
ncbi:MAG: hypothetical protein IJJ61_06855 [Clostridia bacterium]|nr:hypothetical protein [Clostridia bacterium]